MVTSNFTSKFKLLVFTVLGLSIVLSLTLLFFASPNIIQPKFWNDWQSIFIFIVSIGILCFGCLPLLKMNIIRIETQHIVFQKHLLTSNTREVSLKDYDYYKIVHEESENGIFEAVWLIKDGKLMDSFSTYHYSNYRELEAALNLRYEGLLELSPLKQFLCKFGAPI